MFSKAHQFLSKLTSGLPYIAIMLISINFLPSQNSEYFIDLLGKFTSSRVLFY